jgi:hypothetical protein
VSSKALNWASAYAPGIGGSSSLLEILLAALDQYPGSRYVVIINGHEDASNSAVQVECSTWPFFRDTAESPVVNYTLNYHDGVIIHVDYFNTNIICSATLGNIVKTFPAQVYLAGIYQVVTIFELWQDLSVIGVPWNL